MNGSKAGNISFIDLTKDNDNTEEKSDTKVSTVSESIGCSTEIAKSLLVRSDWDVNQAVEDFLNANESWTVPSAADEVTKIWTVMGLVGCRDEIARYLLEYNNWDVDKVVKDVNGSSSVQKSRIDSPVRTHSCKMESFEDINYVKKLVGCTQEIAKYVLENYEWNVNDVVVDFIKFSYGKTVAGEGTTKGGISSVLKRKKNVAPVDVEISNNINKAVYRMLRVAFEKKLSNMRIELKTEEDIMTIVDCSKCSAPQITQINESPISCPVCNAKTCSKCSEQEHEEGKDCGVKRSKVLSFRSFDAKCNQQEHEEEKDHGFKRTRVRPSSSFDAKCHQQEHVEKKDCVSKRTRVRPSTSFSAKCQQQELEEDQEKDRGFKRTRLLPPRRVNAKYNRQEYEEERDRGFKRTRLQPPRRVNAKFNQQEHEEKDRGFKRTKLLSSKSLETKFYEQEHEEGTGCWFKKTRVLPSRFFDAENNLEHEFRIAEGQFLRMKREGRRYEIQSIDIIENEKLKAKFEKKRQDLKAKGVDGKPLLIFHGTPQANIDPILKNNFDIKKMVNGRVHGDGVYFSEMPEVSLGYSRDMQSLILCMVLLGENAKEVKKTKVGAWAVVVPDVDQILPKYVINFKVSGTTPSLARLPILPRFTLTPRVTLASGVPRTPLASTSGSGTDWNAAWKAAVISSLITSSKNKKNLLKALRQLEKDKMSKI